MQPTPRRRCTPLLLPFLLLACGIDSEQAPRVERSVVVDSRALGAFDNDLGYHIELTTMRVAFDNVEFTTGGEMHASLAARIGELFIPTAYAHPGHYAGGEITGEMTGRFIVDWLDDGAALGTATMLVADYSGANFVFTRARAGDGVAGDDPLIGHTIEVGGIATRDGEQWDFHGFLDEEEGKRVVGLPIGEEVAAGAATPHLPIDEDGDEVLGLEMLMVDPFEGDTAFDNLDFAELDDDGDGIVEIVAGETAANYLIKQLQVHDQYAVRVR